MARGGATSKSRQLAVLAGKAIVWFIGLSVLWVVIYRFVPPPYTATMAGDVIAGRSVTKDWMSLTDMDPDMARAAIAGGGWQILHP